jgi:hypothetical protein
LINNIKEAARLAKNAATLTSASREGAKKNGKRLNRGALSFKMESARRCGGVG